MLRIVLPEILLFLLPFIAYGIWLRFGGRDVLALAEWRDAPLVWLSLGGMVLAAAGFFAFAEITGAEPDAIYVPPRYENGTLVPGHFEPRRAP